MEARETIQKRISIIRQEHGLTQEELASIAGVSKGTVSRWESGEIKTLRIDKIKRIADKYDYNPLWIMGYDVGKSKQQEETIKKIDLIYDKLTQMSDEQVSKVLRFIDEFL